MMVELIYICKITFVQANLCAEKNRISQPFNNVGQVCILIYWPVGRYYDTYSMEVKEFVPSYLSF